MCDPPAIIEWTNVRILRPGRAPPIRPTRRTVAFTRASNPSRWVSVATSNNPALATRFESSKVTSIRSIACDTRLTGSASWLPDNEGFRHPHRPSPGGLSRGYATRHTHDRSVHRGLGQSLKRARSAGGGMSSPGSGSGAEGDGVGADALVVGVAGVE